MYGLITMLLWSVVAYWTQETAHEVARKYAVQKDKTVAIETGHKKINMLGGFIDRNATYIEVSAPSNPKPDATASATVTSVPSIKKLYIFSLPEIKRSSEAMLEDHRFDYTDTSKQYIGK